MRRVRKSPQPRAIVTRAAETGADLVVVGSYGRGHASGPLVGSVCAAVAATAPCGVRIARTPTLRGVFIVDAGPPDGVAATTAVARWPMFASAPTTVASVANVTTLGEALAARAELFAQARLATQLHTLRADGRDARGIVVRSDGPAQLLHEARACGADLVACASSGRAHDAAVLALLLGCRDSVLIARAIAAGLLPESSEAMLGAHGKGAYAT